ncbi:hypothetical protein HYR99_14315 [Candidatus Poribacteria bacterium]|nr:hypothetical protein [Candidatus Poribacteria bacterium]
MNYRPVMFYYATEWVSKSSRNEAGGIVQKTAALALCSIGTLGLLA